MRYKVRYGEIAVETYCKLRVESGLAPKTEEAATIGLRNSLCCVVVLDTHNQDEVIGMGRLVGDGACHCQIVDICVLPAHQKQGLGKLIMSELDAYIQAHIPDSCYINLIADGEAYRLYEQYGFKEVWPASRGMGYTKKK